jgi:hypothetical protein
MAEAAGERLVIGFEKADSDRTAEPPTLVTV